MTGAAAAAAADAPVCPCRRGDHARWRSTDAAVIARRSRGPGSTAATDEDDDPASDNPVVAANERCYVHAFPPSEAATCLDRSWTVFLGDSTTRGLVLSLLKLMLGRGMLGRGNTAPAIAAWLGLPPNLALENPINVAFLDWLFVYEDPLSISKVPLRLLDVRRHALPKCHVRNLTQTDCAQSHLRLLRHVSADRKALEAQRYHVIRVTYKMTRWIPDLVETLESSLMQSTLREADYVIVGGGTWDLYYFSSLAVGFVANDDEIAPAVAHPGFSSGGGNGRQWARTSPWHAANRLTTEADLWTLRANELYTGLLRRVGAWCNADNDWVGKCIWLQPTLFGWAGRFDTANFESIFAKIVRRALSTEAPNVHVLDRLYTARGAGRGEKVDGVHASNLLNLWHVHQWIGMVCVDASIGCVVRPPDTFSHSPHGCSAAGARPGRGQWTAYCEITEQKRTLASQGGVDAAVLGLSGYSLHVGHRTAIGLSLGFYIVLIWYVCCHRLHVWRCCCGAHYSKALPWLKNREC